jgi:hypothetical protein
MDLRPGSTFFLEQIRGGAAGAGCVWQKKVGVELFFQIWSCLELCQTRPKCALVKSGEFTTSLYKELTIPCVIHRCMLSIWYAKLLL